MPPPYSRGRGGPNRRYSRSISPPQQNRHKRSWLQPSDRSHQRQRSPSPSFRGPQRKNYKPSPGYRQPSQRSRSQSPRQQKHPKWRSPDEGSHSRQHASRGGRSNDFRVRPRSRSRSRHRSASPKPPPKSENSSRSHHHKRGKASSPEENFSSPPVKKKPRPSSPVPRKRSASHSPDLSFSVRNSREAGGKGSAKARKTDEGAAAPTRKVSSSSKRKAARVTLHKRFTMDDQGPFELNVKDNVTIAILRNPTAKPSEDVTVERIFDATVFKMVRKKHEGRRPIFDREEIKVWRHDENLTDDPDFERRLIRVKSAPHKVGDSLTRMSPEVLRKAFGLNVSGERSLSRSPDRKQQVRLDPRPDPRYEAKYRQQMEKQQEGDRHRSASSKKRVGIEERRGREERKDEGHVKKRNKDDASYDLRHALERRRSDREESFQIEVQRDDIDNSDTELFYRDQRRFSDDDRNVVFNRNPQRYDSDVNTRGGRRGRGDGEPKRFTFGRGRGRGRGIRGGAQFRQDWSPERHVSEDRNRDPSWERRQASRPQSFERRGRMSVSPPRGRGWRDNGFRGRGRGRGRDFDEGSDRGSPPPDMYYKYAQHDDRDVSPRIIPGRGRGRRIARGFGSKGFRGTTGFRPRRARGFGIRGRGRWSFDKGDRGGDRFHDVSVEREWKHDMYDSLQTEGEERRSTNSAN